MPAYTYRLAPAAPPDPRRTITEVVLDSETDLGIARFTKLDIHPQLGSGPAVLGNHFHRNDRERFIVVGGYGVLHTRELDDEGRATSGVEITEIGPDMVIVMEPFTAHTFVFDGPATMFCASTCTFDSNDAPAYLLAPEEPAARAARNLRAMAAHVGGKDVGRRGNQAVFSFPNKDGSERYVCLTDDHGLALGSNPANRFSDMTLGQVLASAREYVGL